MLQKTNYPKGFPLSSKQINNEMALVYNTICFQSWQFLFVKTHLYSFQKS